jgi:hypothetical protein
MAKEFCIKKVNRLVEKLQHDFQQDDFPSVCDITHYQFAQQFYCENEDWEEKHFIEVATAQVMDSSFRNKCISILHFRDVWELFINTYGHQEKDDEDTQETIGGVDFKSLKVLPAMEDFLRKDSLPLPMPVSHPGPV